MPLPTTCDHCNGTNLYNTRIGSAGATGWEGMNGPALLPKLGGFFTSAELDVVVCADCGLTRLFAEPEAWAKLATSKRWRRVGGA